MSLYQRVRNQLEISRAIARYHGDRKTVTTLLAELPEDGVIISREEWERTTAAAKLWWAHLYEFNPEMLEPSAPQEGASDEQE